MTVRTTLVAALQQWADRHEGEIAPGIPEQMADAYAAEVLANAAAQLREDAALRETEGETELAAYGRELAEFVTPAPSDPGSGE